MQSSSAVWRLVHDSSQSRRRFFCCPRLYSTMSMIFSSLRAYSLWSAGRTPGTGRSRTSSIESGIAARVATLNRPAAVSSRIARSCHLNAWCDRIWFSCGKVGKTNFSFVESVLELISLFSAPAGMPVDAGESPRGRRFTHGCFHRARLQRDHRVREPLMINKTDLEGRACMHANDVTLEYRGWTAYPKLKP